MIDQYLSRLKIFMMRKTLLLISAVILVFTHTHAQQLEKLYDFEIQDGKFTYSHLVSDGNYLYGMSNGGGEFDKGTIYKVKKDGSEFVKLYDFDGVNGDRLYNSLTLVGQELFGVAYRGGAADKGVLFKISTDGSNFQKLIDFGIGNNGMYPNCTLYHMDGFLYGTTYSGGNTGSGIFFKIKTDGSDFTELHYFNNTDVVSPHGNFVFDGEYFYGASFNGNGVYNSTIYKIKPDGTGFMKLHDFPDELTNTNVSPNELLLVDDVLYGTTIYSEIEQDGYVYSLKTDGTDFLILHQFVQQSGIQPRGKLTFSNDFLYGTTTVGGGIFKIGKDGTDFENIFTFNNESGYSALAGLHFEDDAFFGTTFYGGINGYGTVYKFTEESLSADDLNSMQISIFPNPVRNFVQIQSETEVKTFQLYSITGKQLMKKAELYKNKLDLTELPIGIYILKLLMTDGRIKALKLIKE